MKELQIVDGKLFILGTEYPPTQHNLEVWNEYKKSKDKEILKRLSTIVLSFE